MQRFQRIIVIEVSLVVRVGLERMAARKNLDQIYQKGL